MINTDRYKIILGSGSPRRQELLSTMGINFTVAVSDVPEIVPSEIPLREHAAYLSKLKANALSDQFDKHHLIITADTVVIIDDIILNKPKDKEEAMYMLQLLSGQTHSVITAVTITIPTVLQRTISDEAKVTFADITEDEADWYIDHHQVLDKAGSYGVQDWLGLAKVNEIDGSYFTIMGLPTHRLYQMLADIVN